MAVAFNCRVWIVSSRTAPYRFPGVGIRVVFRRWDRQQVSHVGHELEFLAQGERGIRRGLIERLLLLACANRGDACFQTLLECHVVVEWIGAVWRHQGLLEPVVEDQVFAEIDDGLLERRLDRGLGLRRQLRLLVDFRQLGCEVVVGKPAKRARHESEEREHPAGGIWIIDLDCLLGLADEGEHIGVVDLEHRVGVSPLWPEKHVHQPFGRTGNKRPRLQGRTHPLPALQHEQARASDGVEGLESPVDQHGKSTKPFEIELRRLPSGEERAGEVTDGEDQNQEGENAFHRMRGSTVQAVAAAEVRRRTKPTRCSPNWSSRPTDIKAQEM
jgi:hypothetical protein